MATQIGPYTLNLLETGRFALDGGAMFGVVPKNIWEKTNPPDDQNRIDMALRILLIQSKNKNILVDTGIGTKWDEKYAKIYRIDHGQFTLEKSLSKFHLSPTDITDVILTHLHFDHVGGSTYREADQLKLTFPNAVHYIQKEQWEWAHQPCEKDRASFLKENFDPLSGKNLKLLEGETEIYPGIYVMISHGHTQAQQVVKVTDGRNTVFYCGDLIPTSSHIPVPFVMGYDNLPVLIMQEKKYILEQAIKGNWILCFEHDPKIGAATITRDPQKWRYSIKDVVLL